MLTALIGRFASEEPAEQFELASLHLPRELPVSLPSKLVEQRPTVQSAEAQLHAASAAIGVAVAARLPQFTLGPSAGLASNQIDTLFMTPGTAFWTLVGTVSQTVFDDGALLRRRPPPSMRQRRCIPARSLPPYRMLPTRCTLQSDADTLKAAAAADRAAFKSLEITRTQLQLGAVNYPRC